MLFSLTEQKTSNKYFITLLLSWIYTAFIMDIQEARVVLRGEGHHALIHVSRRGFGGVQHFDRPPRPPPEIIQPQDSTRDIPDCSRAARDCEYDLERVITTNRECLGSTMSYCAYISEFLQSL